MAKPATLTPPIVIVPQVIAPPIGSPKTRTRVRAWSFWETLSWAREVHRAVQSVPRQRWRAAASPWLARLRS